MTTTETKPNETKASTAAVSKALANPEAELRPGMTLKAMLRTTNIKQRFEEILGQKAAGFISSILTVVGANDYLKSADPNSVIAAAAVAASLDLPINPSLGLAHIVPYKGLAQFQLGWRGYVQLAQRTGQYRTMNVSEVYEGQLIKNDPFTGVMEFDAEKKSSDKIVGYVAYFRMLNGFEKYLYMTTEQVQTHGKRYSKSFESDNGQWKQNFSAMAKKTAIKLLLSKWAMLSIELQKAIAYDQAVVGKDEKPEYIDGHDAIDAETVTETKTETAPEAKPEPPKPDAKAAPQWDVTFQVDSVALTEKNKKEAWVVYTKDSGKFLTGDKATAELCKSFAGLPDSLNADTEKDGKDIWLREVEKA